MDLQFIEKTLCSIFGDNNVKPHSMGFRIIVNFENMPYCVVLRMENERLVMERDAIDEEEKNYDEAYKKAYKMLIQNRDKFGDRIVI